MLLAATATDMAMAAVFALIGLWLIVARRRWADDVYLLASLRRSGPHLAAFLGALFLVAAAMVVLRV